MGNESFFLEQILALIAKEDSLHYKKVKHNVEEIVKSAEKDFTVFLKLLYEFFSKRRLPVAKVAGDYLKMINDMRREGIYFKKNGVYSCTNQYDAYVNVYSRKEVMEYYMNALLLSQILWLHHFKMLMFFNNKLNAPFLSNTEKILDIGPGHGFFSYLTINHLKSTSLIDIVDISDESLEMTKNIIGDGGGKIKYFNRDIFNYESSAVYDLIILGEVLEHLDEPLLILNKLRGLLTENGYLWFTTPTNAPALDHVYLFRSKNEIRALVERAGFDIVSDFGCFAEDVSEKMAIRFNISFLYGAFMKAKKD